MKVFHLLEIALAAESRRVDTTQCFSVGFTTKNDLYEGKHDLSLTRVQRSKGDVSVTTSGKKCMKWKTVRRNAKNLNVSNAIRRKIRSRKYASETPNSCRNPDDDPNGPWCYYEGKS